jgi:hypothetical protein
MRRGGGLRVRTGQTGGGIRGVVAVLCSALSGRRLVWPVVVGVVAGLSVVVSVALGDTASPPKNTVPPAVQGTAAAFETVTCLPGQWIPAAETYTYLWALDGSSEGMPTTATWNLTTSQVNHTVSCDVTATDPTTGLHNVAASATVTVEQGEITSTALPTISGTPSPGKKLSCSTGSWSPQPDSYSYLWLKNGGAIEGATTAQYTVSDGDVGHTLTCQVVATIGNNAASGNATSHGVAAVSAPTATTTVATTTTTTVTTTTTTTTTTKPTTVSKPIDSTRPGIAVSGGHASTGIVAGQSLQCDSGSWTGSPTLAEAWYELAPNGNRLHPALVPRELAKGTKLLLPSLPPGIKVYCQITATGATGHTVATSPDLVVKAIPPTLAKRIDAYLGGAPTIVRGVEAGGTNACDAGTWLNYPSRYTYKWYVTSGARSGVPRLVGTGENVPVRATDTGKYLFCKVTAVNIAGSVSATSPAYKVPPLSPLPVSCGAHTTPSQGCAGAHIEVIVPSQPKGQTIDPPTSVDNPLLSKANPPGIPNAARYLLECLPPKFNRKVHITYTWTAISWEFIFGENMTYVAAGAPDGQVSLSGHFLTVDHGQIVLGPPAGEPDYDTENIPGWLVKSTDDSGDQVESAPIGGPGMLRVSCLATGTSGASSDWGASSSMLLVGSAQYFSTFEDTGVVDDLVPYNEQPIPGEAYG